MDGATPEEGARLLRRATILDVCREEALGRSQLADAADLSRTTAYRATLDLEAADLLERTSEGYRTTPHGAALSAAVDQFLLSIETINRLEGLLELVNHPDLVAHAHLFADARVVVADAENPYRVVERVLERFEQTVTSRGVMASVSHTEAINRAAPDVGDKEFIERIFAASALDSHLTVGGEVFAAAGQNDGVSYLVAPDETVPFSFAIDDESVTLVGHDPTLGLPTIHAESDHPAARAWLEHEYEQIRADAEPVHSDEIPSSEE